MRIAQGTLGGMAGAGVPNSTRNTQASNLYSLRALQTEPEGRRDSQALFFRVWSTELPTDGYRIMRTPQSTTLFPHPGPRLDSRAPRGGRESSQLGDQARLAALRSLADRQAARLRGVGRDRRESRHQGAID